MPKHKRLTLLSRASLTIGVLATGTWSAAAGSGPAVVTAATAHAPAERLATRPAGPATTSPPTATTTPANPNLALTILASITVANEQPAGYSRDLFPHWRSTGNGCDTRDSVLIAESLTPAQVSYPGCAVIEGDWYSTYDNQTETFPSDIDIDHTVALKEAWDSGAWSWTPQQRTDFANDLTDGRSLIAVTDNSNQSKGANDPSNWLPPHQPAVCRYLADWISVKARWNLSMDQSEHGRIRNVINDSCPGLTVAPTSAPPGGTPADPDTGGGATTTTTSTTPNGNCDPSYPDVCIPPPPPDLNCGDITFRNFRVLQPDPHRFDGNKDGIGCSA
jgi:hypothetical protein